MITYLLFLLGIIFLVKGAGYLVEGASVLAKKIGVNQLVIGLTVVAFGTSLPELLVNLFSAAKGETAIALGNILGSNIVNILLILGVAAIVYPIKVPHSTVWKEIPFSLLAALILLVMANDALIDKSAASYLGRIDGIIMISFFVIFIYYLFGLAKLARFELKKRGDGGYSAEKILFLILIGIVGLLLGGKWVVDGAVIIAQRIGLSKFFISATIISVGTSLPELVTSIVAATKRKEDLAIGNVVGSNIFNILFILGITAVINPIGIAPLVSLDMLFLVAITFLLFVFMFLWKKQEIGRTEGTFFVILYIIYIAWLFLRG